MPLQRRYHYAYYHFITPLLTPINTPRLNYHTPFIITASLPPFIWAALLSSPRRALLDEDDITYAEEYDTTE